MSIWTAGLTMYGSCARYDNVNPFDACLLVFIFWLLNTNAVVDICTGNGLEAVGFESQQWEEPRHVSGNNISLNSSLPLVK